MAETVDDEAEKELVVKVWGKLVIQVIGGMKNGFLVVAKRVVPRDEIDVMKSEVLQYV